MKYCEEIKRTMNTALTNDEMFLNGVLGLAGESGEVVDLVKKFRFHGKAFDKDKLVNELGDVRYYLELIALAIEVPMDEIERLNIEKLTTRYPNGWSAVDSELRRDVKK